MKKEFFFKFGLAREAFFYAKFGKDMDNFNIPKCYYAYGDMKTGDKIVILEDIEEYLNTNYCLGKHHPFSYMLGDYEEKTKDLKYSPQEICIDVATNLAHFHARFWEDKTLFNEKWIKNSDHMLGENKDQWLHVMDELKNEWENFKKDGMEGTPADQIIDLELKDIINASLEKINYEQYRKDKNQDSKNWT